MKIEKLDLIAFGKFKDFHINLEEGINVIKGNNESGKSTISAFIRGIFYGFVKDSLKKRSYENDKFKYKPWIHEEYRGYIILEYKNETYRVERDFENSEISLTNLTKSYDLSKDERLFKYSKVAQPGALFFDVNSRVFSNTFYIGQLESEVAQGSYESLKEKFENFLTTEDEKFDGRKSVEILREKLAQLGKENKKNSEIGEIYSRLEKTNEYILGYAGIEKDLSGIKKQLKEIEEKIVYAKNRNLLISKVEDQRKYDKITGYQEKIKELESEIDEDCTIDYETYEKLTDLEKRYYFLENKFKEIMEKIDKDIEEPNNETLQEYRDDLIGIRTLNNRISELNSKNYSKEMNFLLDEINSNKIVSNKYFFVVSISLLITATILMFSLINKKYIFIVLIPFILTYAYLRVQKFRISKDYVNRLNIKLKDYKQKSYDKTVEKKKIDKDFDELFDKYEVKMPDLKLSKDETIQKRYAVLQDKLEHLINLENEDSFKYNLKKEELKVNEIKLENIKSEMRKIGKIVKEICLKHNTDSIEDFKDKFNNGIIQSSKNSEIKILTNNIENLLGSRKQESLNHNIDLEKIEIEENILNINSLEIERVKIKQNLINVENKYKEYLELLDEKKYLSSKIEELNEKKEHLEKAAEIIEKLLEKNAEELLPKIIDKVEFYLSKITKQKYGKVIIDDKFNISIYDKSKKNFVKLESLSNGTVDQVYFSFRLSVTDYIFEEVPLILDDHFLQYDDLRMENILDYLSEEKRQIIIFTATDRETKALKKLNKKYNLIEME
ncbi:Hypothetical protein ING2D1G_0637 [Peptoniphilus sp. ING2-D1G]|nr:Hypothetical protein ING2D1G_0637 [Peptoniphilus sp. ING2-D1G]